MMTHLFSENDANSRLQRNQRPDKVRAHFRDLLQGKAVVLSNTSMQKKANSSEQRKKRFVVLAAL
jgi:hypothetical protein